jgi:hypothetical protein
MQLACAPLLTSQQDCETTLLAARNVQRLPRHIHRREAGRHPTIQAAASIKAPNQNTSASTTCATQSPSSLVFFTSMMYRPLRRPDKATPCRLNTSTAACDVCTSEKPPSAAAHAPQRTPLRAGTYPPASNARQSRDTAPQSQGQRACSSSWIQSDTNANQRCCCTHTNKLLPEMLVVIILQYACNSPASKTLSPHPCKLPPRLSFRNQTAQYISQPCKALQKQEA